MTGGTRDHGGGLDAAMAAFGGCRSDWLDLSTGINPVPYPVEGIPDHAWSTLPDTTALDRLLNAARAVWSVPDSAQIVAAPGASAVIARLPFLGPTRGEVHIPAPTYNEHAAAFGAGGQWVLTGPETKDTHVYVHPNNPDGRLWDMSQIGGRRRTIIDESFCDTCPDQSHVALTKNSGVLVLKSFGKFWGLAGLRLGFAIGTPETLSPRLDSAPAPSLTDHLGPWAIAGPALEIGARALEDLAWAEATRARLRQDAARLDQLMIAAGAAPVGGTDLFRLYSVDDAAAAQTHLARHHIWSRIFPYSRHWLRLGLPHPDRWAQLEAALGTAGGAMLAPAEPASDDQPS